MARNKDPVDIVFDIIKIAIIIIIGFIILGVIWSLIK